MSQFQIEKRFGYTAVKMGYITEDQLAEAIIIQIKEDLTIGKHRQTGQILLSLGHITEGAIREVLKAISYPISFYDGYVPESASKAPFIQRLYGDHRPC